MIGVFRLVLGMTGTLLEPPWARTAVFRSTLSPRTCRLGTRSDQGAPFVEVVDRVRGDVEFGAVDAVFVSDRFALLVGFGASGLADGCGDAIRLALVSLASSWHLVVSSRWLVIEPIVIGSSPGRKSFRGVSL